ncbi:vWA domain-containing protein [Litorimonas sp. WD9-15]|uniref:vWA domain-containing protein n=1 Tax=Litorimonas sp. WD9-15 TaxID=3418716 RepID=UPI003D042C61
MRKFLISAAILGLAACETVGEPATGPVDAEIVVTSGTRAVKPAPPAPVASYQAWDGSLVFSPSQVAAEPVFQNSFAIGNGQIVDIIESPEGNSTYVIRDEAGQVIREFPSRDEFEAFTSNPYKHVADSPVSTFSSDVDTASYSVARSFLKRGQRPPKDAIRIEEILNYFDYDYDKPRSQREPFKPSVAIVPSPWNAETKLIHIGVQGYAPPKSKRPPMNLVFLVDISGSMDAENKLALLKRSFEPLLEELESEDRVSIVTYGPRMETILVPTPGNRRAAIRAALAPLVAKGGTNGEAGLQQAYRVAEQSFMEDGVNRVILATDGDFNIGISDPADLKQFVEEKRETGVYLSVLGFGQGDLKDNRMQALAQNGNGTAYYIDTLQEARKVFVTDFAKNLIPIADDLKLQVEFNPTLVSEYRLLGYETRALRRQDFNNDKVDAGDIGSGHSVTAIYEILPVGAVSRFVDPLRYGQAEVETSEDLFSNEYGFLKLRYKKPGEATSTLISKAIRSDDEYASLRRAPDATQLAAAVGGYALGLRDDGFAEDLDLAELSDIAKRAKGRDRYGYRAEFLELIETASKLNER